MNHEFLQLWEEASLHCCGYTNQSGVGIVNVHEHSELTKTNGTISISPVKFFIQWSCHFST